MNQDKSYKLFGICTRKVLFEKYFTIQQQLEWVVFNKVNAKHNNNEKSYLRWQQLENYFFNYPEKFERMVSKIRNEVK